MSVFRKARTLELVLHRRSDRLTIRTWSNLLRQQQFLATDKQVDQGAGDEQAVPVLLQSPITHLHESELQLHHLKHVLDFGSHLRLGSVLRPRYPVHDLILVATAPLGVIPRAGRALANHLGLSLIGSVAPNPRLFAV